MDWTLCSMEAAANHRVLTTREIAAINVCALPVMNAQRNTARGHSQRTDGCLLPCRSFKTSVSAPLGTFGRIGLGHSRGGHEGGVFVLSPFSFLLPCLPAISRDTDYSVFLSLVDREVDVCDETTFTFAWANSKLPLTGNIRPVPVLGWSHVSFMEMHPCLSGVKLQRCNHSSPRALSPKKARLSRCDPNRVQPDQPEKEKVWWRSANNVHDGSQATRTIGWEGGGHHTRKKHAAAKCEGRIGAQRGKEVGNSTRF